MSPKNCESHSTWFVIAGFGSGCASLPHFGLLCWRPDGELVGSPPPASLLPWKQFVGLGPVEVISPKSLFVSFPKKPLCLNVLFAISLPSRRRGRGCRGARCSRRPGSPGQAAASRCRGRARG